MGMRNYAGYAGKSGSTITELSPHSTPSSILFRLADDETQNIPALPHYSLANVVTDDNVLQVHTCYKFPAILTLDNDMKFDVNCASPLRYVLHG